MLLMRQAQEDMKALIDQQSHTAKERAELQAALDKEAEDRRRIEEQKKSLVEKLKAMEEKLIKGGEVISKASKQEALLRKTEQELRERQIQVRPLTSAHYSGRFFYFSLLFSLNFQSME